MLAKLVYVCHFLLKFGKSNQVSVLKMESWDDKRPLLSGFFGILSI